MEKPIFASWWATSAVTVATVQQHSGKHQPDVLISIERIRIETAQPESAAGSS